jgi:YVTN family beta-propeller protein
MAITPDGDRLFVAGASLAIVDLGSNKVVDTMPISTTEIAFNKSGSVLYALNYPKDQFFIIDPVQMKVVHQVTIGKHPKYLAVTPGGGKVYVACDNEVNVMDWGSGDILRVLDLFDMLIASPTGLFVYAVRDRGWISSIDTNTDAIAVVAGSPSLGRDVGIAINPSGNRLYRIHNDEGEIAVVGLFGGGEVTRVKVDFDSRCLAVSPDGSLLYCVNGRSRSISLIDTNTNQLLYSIPSDVEYSQIVINPSGDRAYVAGRSSRVISVLALNWMSPGEELGTVPVGQIPYKIVINNTGTRAYVGNSQDGTVSEINMTTNAVTDIPVGVGTMDLAISPDGSRLYVANLYSNDVSVIDTGTQAEHRIHVGRPGPIVFNPDATLVYVLNMNDPTVSVISTQTELLLGTFPIYSYAEKLTFGGKDHDRMYVANSSTASVDIYDINLPPNRIGSVKLSPDYPVECLASPDGSAVYVLHGEYLTVIDTAYNTVAAPIARLTAQAKGLAVTPDGLRVYLVRRRHDKLCRPRPGLVFQHCHTRTSPGSLEGSVQHFRNSRETLPPLRDVVTPCGTVASPSIGRGH